jgi:hypothetical protein
VADVTVTVAVVVAAEYFLSDLLMLSSFRSSC